SSGGASSTAPSWGSVPTSTAWAAAGPPAPSASRPAAAPTRTAAARCQDLKRGIGASVLRTRPQERQQTEHEAARAEREGDPGQGRRTGVGVGGAGRAALGSSRLRVGGLVLGGRLSLGALSGGEHDDRRGVLELLFALPLLGQLHPGGLALLALLD